MAVLLSSGAWLANAKSSSTSTALPSSGSRGTAVGGLMARSRARIDASSSPASGPSSHVTSSASLASSACPNVSATTATPVSTTSTPRKAVRESSTTARSTTPGIARTAASLSTDTTRPRMVSGRRTIERSSPGTGSRSLV